MVWLKGELADKGCGTKDGNVGTVGGAGGTTGNIGAAEEGSDEVPGGSIESVALEHDVEAEVKVTRGRNGAEGRNDNPALSGQLGVNSGKEAVVIAPAPVRKEASGGCDICESRVGSKSVKEAVAATGAGDHSVMKAVVVTGTGGGSVKEEVVATEEVRPSETLTVEGFPCSAIVADGEGLSLASRRGLSLLADAAIASSASSTLITARLIFSLITSACSISASSCSSSKVSSTISSSSFRRVLAFSVRDSLSCLSFRVSAAVTAPSS